MDSKLHWEKIYTSKPATDVSWFQREARKSMEFICRVAADKDAAIVDVGGGASTLADGLLRAGFRKITVLDLSAAGLAQARERLGGNASRVTWLEANALDPVLPEAGIDVWHDRAVFHFLTEQADCDRYVEQVRRAVRPGGYVVIATFAEDGPDRCSGLPVAKYSPKALCARFGAGFKYVEGDHEDHITPGGVHQSFQYCLCRYLPRAA